MRSLLGLAAVLAVTACSAGETSVTGDEEDLTSLSARARVLTFQGEVYVAPGASESEILDVVHDQTQPAFGALLASKVAVQSREVQNVDPRSFRKRVVTMVDPAGAEREMLEVRYTYTDNAVVPVAMARKTALSLALLGQGHKRSTDAIVAACTKNDKEAHDDAAMGLLWYDFDPTRASCRHAMEAEQRAIDDDTGKLADPKKMVPKSRTERVYLPVTMSLARSDTATRATYPEYDRLFSGGAEPGVLTVVLLNGRLAHEHVEAVKDDGYYQWMDTLGVIFADNPDFVLTKVEPDADVTSATGAGKRWDNLSFKDFIQWTVYGNGWPSGMPASGRDDIARHVASTLDGRWITFEKKVKVAIGDKPAKDLTIRLETLFGADEDPAPHKRALTRGDVVVYNGHSYIGYGPLDPDNFRRTHFPDSYQILFFDSCVSYNYYEKDFFQLKPGGSKSLDMITNGLEAPEWRSGEAEGKFIVKLIGGSMPSYQTLLEVAKATDSLRVVDGEIDNSYDPSRTPVRVSSP